MTAKNSIQPPKHSAAIASTAATTELACDDIPFFTPSIGPDEIAEVVDTLKNGWLTSGPKVAQLESEFAAFVGATHAIAVNSATSGLHLALEALGLGAGDRVVTTTNTFTATAEVVRYFGAHPIFVDIEPQTMNINTARIEALIDSHDRVVGIIPVHLAGQACDLDEIHDIARRRGLWVVEDAAHALPTTYKRRMIGSHSDATVFSFYATKTLTTGEGGMITTGDPNTAQRMRLMRLHGINRDSYNRAQDRVVPWRYEVIAPGYKYNMMDMCAALGIHQLRRASALREQRAEIARRYDNGLAGTALRLPVSKRQQDQHAHHLYIIQLELEALTIGRDRFIEMLSDRGIAASVHFIPLHLQPYWRDTYGLNPSDFPVANAVFERCVSLPIYPSLKHQSVDRVIEAVRDVLNAHAR